MAALLFVLVVVVPVVELYVLVQVASWIGALPAIALVLLVSFAGVWLVKREGLSVARRVQSQIRRGEAPATEMVNALLILIAGVLMVFPGFVTAAAGLILLLPPTRALVRRLVMRRLEARIATLTTPGGPVFGGVRAARVFTGSASYGGAGVVDVHEVDRSTPADHRPGPHPDPPELGRY